MAGPRELRAAHVAADLRMRASPLVRWTGDLYVPRSVTALLLYGDATTIEVQIDMIDRGTRAEPVVRSITVKAHASQTTPSTAPPERDKRSVSPADVRVPFEAMIEAALAPLAQRLTVDDDGRQTYERLVPELDAPVPPLPRRRRTRIDDALLERVANAYLEAEADPTETRTPAQVVADTVTHDGHPPAGGTVWRWIKAAREAGLIPERP